MAEYIKRDYMHVVFLAHYSFLYGANRSLLNLIEGLERYNVKAHVIAPEKGDLTKHLRTHQIPVVTYPYKFWTSNPRRHRSAMKRLYQNTCLIRPLIQQLRSWKIDLIHTNSLVLPIGAIASKLLDLPHVWHLREFGDLDYDQKYDFGKRASRLLLNRASARIAISKAVCRHFQEQMFLDRMDVIYNGILWKRDFDHWQRQSQSDPKPQQIRTFALVGVILPNKGQETAIRALALVKPYYPNVRLLLAGGGGRSLYQQVQSLV